MELTIQGSFLLEDYCTYHKVQSTLTRISWNSKYSQNFGANLLVAKPFNKINIGPNVNLKIPKKFLPTEEEKEFFKKKIRSTKKTEMCKNWSLYHDCYFKQKCSFAHGDTELRQKTKDNTKYKTKVCKTFSEKAFCPFGNRCVYSHIIKNNRKVKYDCLNTKFANEVISTDKPEDFEETINSIKTKSIYNVPRLEVFAIIHNSC